MYMRLSILFFENFALVSFSDVSYETSGGTGSKHRSKNAVIRPFSLFGSCFVHTMGRLSLKQPKNPSKSRFLAFLGSDFWSFLRKILSEIVWEAFLKGQKSPILPKNSHFFALRLSFFRLFSRLFRGSLFLSKRLKKAWKKPFLRIFELILPLAQGKNAEKPTKEQRTRVPGRIQTKNLIILQEILPKIDPARLYANDARTENA